MKTFSSDLNTAPTAVSEETDLVVDICRTPEEIQAGMEFCSRIYKKTYNTYWDVAPDVFFTARKDGEVVATGGLKLASRHSYIGAEKYFYMTPRMRTFIDQNRSDIAEFGRFSSKNRQGAKAILHAAITYCQEAGITFLVAWANPSVYTHGAKELGCPFWVIDVPINEQSVLEDADWAIPPTDFFLREDPPRLLLAVIPFFDLVNHNLAEDYGKKLLLYK